MLLRALTTIPRKHPLSPIRRGEVFEGGDRSGHWLDIGAAEPVETRAPAPVPVPARAKAPRRVRKAKA